MKTTHMNSFYDLRDALSLPGCPICRLQNEYGARFIADLLHERVNDSDTRTKIRHARGLCPKHSRQLLSKGDPLGVSILMRDVLGEVLHQMHSVPPAPNGFWRRMRQAFQRLGSPYNRLAARLGPHGPCPICVYVGEVEEACLQALCDHLLGEDGLLASYRASDGLCLSHFRQALIHATGNEAAVQALLEAQRDIWTRLENQLSEIIRKSDYCFQEEPAGEEAGAWVRAVATLSCNSLDAHAR